MPDDPSPLTNPERPDAAASGRAKASSRDGGFVPGDSPTVLRVARPGGAGSSVQRVEIVEGKPLTLSTPMPLPKAGERIDIFELEAAIGVGGMGAVFRALDTRLDRHVALKILPPEQAYDAEVVQRFYQEGRAAARLDHENIARVFTIGQDALYHFIAFEYIEGTTVRQRVERHGPLAVTEAINYTLQIADALVHAAERGVVHRDIKPSNIIVTPGGRAKLVDMGLARRFERGGDDGLTQSGMTLGTFDYISPEQARDPRDVDVRSDLYSLGCTLFHMLTGRPPFPEGTVLQKLLQHQEDPPPDVRVLNPTVPPDLANILVKLMAKDRDRRYQTPEQLVRDLLTVAGALGLRSVSPEGLVWLSSEATPSWQRHLVWGLPALFFVLIVSGLAWWAQNPGAGVSNGIALNRPVPAVRTANRPPEATGRDSTALPAEAAAPEWDENDTPSPAPRERAVGSNDDLLEAVASAPPRSVILLIDEGPYDLGVGIQGRPSATRLEGRDLTLKAVGGVHPVLRFARDVPPGGKPRTSLLDFVGGQVTLDGLVFLVEPGDRPEPLAAVRVEDTELTVRRCAFRRPGVVPGQGQDATSSRVAAVEVRSTLSPGGGDRPPAVTLDRCHFDAGQVGVRAAGPADLLLRDCTVASSEPAVWLANGPAATSPVVAADVRLRHVSVLAGESPIFRFEGAEPRVWVDDSVFAAVGEGEATLVATDRPDSLTWLGRGNLYARLGVFLLPTDSPLGREAVRDPLRWKEAGEGTRESGSVFEPQSVWNDPDPAQILAQDSQNPAHAFRLVSSHPGVADVGARVGPFGPIAPPLIVALNSSPKPAPSTAPKPRVAVEPRATAPTPEPPATAVTPSNEAPPLSDMPPMRVMPPTGDPDREKEKTPEAVPASVPVPVPAPVPEPPPAPKADHPVLHTVDQLLNSLAEPGAQGRVLNVAADADWELASATVRATGSWRIRAEPGPTRPRLRFLPARAEEMGADSRTALFELRTGSLQIEGFDVVLPRENAPRNGRWAAFAVWPATDLNLTNCTVTVEGDQVDSAVVAIEAADVADDEGLNAAESSAATVRFNDSFFRAGGDLVDVGVGRRLVLEMDNAVAATGGSLIHAHGMPRGHAADRLSLTFRKVTALMAGGLVHLQSSRAEPELHIADVNARYSIFGVTSKDAPLVLVDGQDAPEAMRDRVVWEGRGVGYHLLSTYRRDQTNQVGAVPTLYNRSDWIVAVGSREQMPFHGDVKFARELAPGRAAWDLGREDVRLSKDSPAPASGADLDRIPVPPGDPS